VVGWLVKVRQGQGLSGVWPSSQQHWSEATKHTDPLSTAIIRVLTGEMWRCEEQKIVFGLGDSRKTMG